MLMDIGKDSINLKIRLTTKDYKCNIQLWITNVIQRGVILNNERIT